MEKTEIAETTLVGLGLKSKTTNENGQSVVDCGNLWQHFEKAKIVEKIPGKLSDEILAVYHSYDGDYTQPFSYFIGCKVHADARVPDHLEKLIIPSGVFTRLKARGEMPGCITDAWRKIWSSQLDRAYEVDFEVYDERSKDWSNAEVDIYISMK